MEAFLLLDRASAGLPVLAAGGDLEELTGRTPEQVVGRPWPPAWSEHPAAEALAQLRRAAEDGERASVPVLSGDGIGTDVTMLPLEGHTRLALCRIAEALSPAEMARLAFHDRLTGLPNRVLLERHLALALPRALRTERSVVVLFVDLDRFKQVNDTLGHAAGDELLRQVAARLRATIRPGDIVGRLSGDEFAIILPGLAAVEDAAGLAERITECFAEPFRLDGTDVRIGTSVGLSATRTRAGRTAEDLLRKADAAMYRHKQRGRSAVTAADPRI